MDLANSGHCGDCGRPTMRAQAHDLRTRGWKLLRLRDAYGNPVPWWRCARCVAGGAQPTGEELLDTAAVVAI
jgi:hypothetical protein